MLCETSWVHITQSFKEKRFFASISAMIGMRLRSCLHISDLLCFQNKLCHVVVYSDDAFFLCYGIPLFTTIQHRRTNDCLIYVRHSEGADISNADVRKDIKIFPSFITCTSNSVLEFYLFV